MASKKIKILAIVFSEPLAAEIVKIVADSNVWYFKAPIWRLRLKWIIESLKHFAMKK